MQRPCGGCDRLIPISDAEAATDYPYTTCAPCFAEQVRIRTEYTGVVGTTRNAFGEVIPVYAADWTGPRVTRNPERS